MDDALFQARIGRKDQPRVGFFQPWIFENRDVIRRRRLTAELYAIIKRLIDDRTAFEKASPIERAHAGAPPFMIVQGTSDSLVPTAEARAFAERLRSVSRSPTVYLEIPGAQHAFEVFPSLRSHHVLGGVERFAAHIHRQHRLRSASPSTDSPTQSA